MTDLPSLWQRTPTATLRALLAGARVWCPGDPTGFKAELLAELDTRTAPDLEPPMPEQTVTVGRTVLYTLTQADADRINALPGQSNTAIEGDTYPAIVVRAWAAPLVNLQVLFDGDGSLWATSRTEGTVPGTWHWPTRG